MDDIDQTMRNLPTLKETTEDDKKIPIPSLDFLRKLDKAEQRIDKRDGKMVKHEKAYDAYCRWLATPTAERDPKTELSFEKRWKLPRRYAATFRQRKDFRNRRLLYFWEWMMDKVPDVFYAIYERARKKSSADARVFAEIITKHMDYQRPANQITNIVIQGVSQDKLNNLFIPDEYEKIEDVTPVKEVE